MNDGETSGSGSSGTPRAPSRWLRVKLWFVRNFMPTDTANFLFWAGAVGLIGGLVAVLFPLANEELQQLVFRSSSGMILNSAENVLREKPAWIGWLWIGLVPAVGGLVAGLVLLFGERLTRGAKAPELLEAVTVREGVMRVRPTLVKSLSSLISVSTGASIGREGAIVQLAATLASKVGQLGKTNPQQMRLLVGCGVASGIAAAYNAPIAGALFVAQIIFGNFAMEVFAPVVFASLLATLVSRAAHPQTVFGELHFTMQSPWELIPYLLFGLICGVAAPWFRSSLMGSKRVFDKLPLPLPLKLALGGLIVGGIAIFVPAVLGNGYEAGQRILNGDTLVSWLAKHPLWMGIALVSVLKVFATSVSFGSGAVGGIFTPTLVLGASLGFLFGEGVNAVMPERMAANPAAYALVGMGGLLAGTTHAPLMAMLMIFEMSLNYEIVLPLMLCCVASSYISRRIRAESIYTEPLQEHGGSWRMTPEAMVMTSTRVSEVMNQAMDVVRETAKFDEVVALFLRTRRNHVFVVGEHNELRGAISIHDLKEWMQRGPELQFVIALDLADATFPVATREDRLAEVIEKFWARECERLPVVDSLEQRRLVGTISKRDIFGVYGREILQKEFQLTRVAHRTDKGKVSRYLEIPPPYVLEEIEVDAALDGMKVGQVHLNSKYGLLALLLRTRNDDGSESSRVVTATEKLHRRDVLVVLGKPDDIAQFKREYAERR
jgi:CIC family chloride channel protein